MPASVTPIASTTAMQPSGIASIAARVEIGEDQDSGVARSSRAGTKRRVKARPTSRGWPGRRGLVPRSQTLRRPFFSRTVVMVAVVTLDRVSMISASVAMAIAPVSDPWAAIHLNGADASRTVSATSMPEGIPSC